MRRSTLAAFFCFALAPIAAAETAAPVPRAPGQPYAATGIPDRIVLTPAADPAHGMALAWRTDPRQVSAEAELAVALDGPAIGAGARKIAGTSAPIETENGAALYHQVRFDGLAPDTVYAYRVKGADGWSEWRQFRTAADGFRPFRFLYFGDVQNGILEHGARVIRRAFKATAEPALAVFAGDLVASRDDMTHDDEWGEWNAAGSYNFGETPVLPAAGNHEYVDVFLPDGAESRALAPHWLLQFALPGNGVAPVGATTYAVDYQGVRFVVLDGTAALDLGAMEAETKWLDKVLAEPGPLWRIVVVHQPVYTCARPNDTPGFKENWAPIFAARKVDLVLQGHDHCYARLASPEGRDATVRHIAAGDVQGPVYVVSVTGKKMYGLNDRAATQADRTAADTQLYQVIDVEQGRLAFAAYTATGRLYDAFTLTRAPDGANRLEQAIPETPERLCEGGRGPDGPACIGEPKD